MPAIQRIVPCLWFDDQAEQAAKHYTGIFPNSRIVRTSHYTEAGREVHGRPAGSVLTVEFQLDGQAFTALNGGPVFKFTEAISFQVMCETQEEIDSYWSKLTQGGDPKAQQCGWLRDKFGMAWQVVPRRIAELMADPDTAKTGRVMEALLPMKKLDLAALERAARG